MIAKDDIMKALKNTYGITAKVAQNLGVSWYEAHQAIQSDKDAKREFRSEELLVKDLAKSKLYEAVKSGEQWAIKYMLED